MNGAAGTPLLGRGLQAPEAVAKSHAEFHRALLAPAERLWTATAVLVAAVSVCADADGNARSWPCHDGLLVLDAASAQLEAGHSPRAVRADLDYLRKCLTPVALPIDERPVLGNTEAPVTITAFMDFTCGECGEASRELTRIVENSRGTVRVVHLNTQSAASERGSLAARGCEAAGRQGRFWDIWTALFQTEGGARATGIRAAAADLGLDMERFDLDLRVVAPEVRSHIRLADRLYVFSSPTYYVNGRRVTDLIHGGDLRLWIEDALARGAER
jgi:protein-disulfide isomerase